ncbi:MAG: 50S ribosomal protein L18 [Deltaproteobacteria bacterium]|nr:50S ribosomal protein L18 [Deltaproteobacteria bacterium]
MGTHLHHNSNARQRGRIARKVRIWKKINRRRGLRARLVVYRSNRFLYAQLIDDLKGHTLVQANSREKELQALPSRKNLETAKAVGKLLGGRALAAKITKVVFDRNGYDYHGRVKAFADGAREAGLEF